MAQVAGKPHARRMLVGLFMTAALTVGLAIGPASPASAVSVSCGWPRCTLYLTKTETRNWAYYDVIPEANVCALSSIWYIFAMTHRWFAIQYANQGMCVGFNLSALPWEKQGMFGYRC